MKSQREIIVDADDGKRAVRDADAGSVIVAKRSPSAIVGSEETVSADLFCKTSSRYGHPQVATLPIVPLEPTL